VLVAKTVDTFQFDEEYVVHKDICEVFPDALFFVDNRERSLRGSRHASKFQLSKQSSFVDLFKKPGAECIGNLEDSAQHALWQVVYKLAFIGVHLRLIS